MKQLLILLFFIFSTNIFAQEVKYTGKIIDKQTKKIVSGAILWAQGRTITASDENGEFELIHSDLNTSDSIFVYHMAYQYVALSVNSLKATGNVIELSEEVFALSTAEVRSVNIKKLIKEAAKQFKSTYRTRSCWAYTNYSQVVSYRGKACGSYEYDGKTLFNSISKLKTMTANLYMPDYVRRTVEDTIIISHFYFPRDRFIAYQATEAFRDLFFTDFVFFEVLHPLGKTGDFSFKLETKLDFNGVSCYLISFEQKWGIGSGNWKVTDMRGQIWLDMDKNLVKTKVTFNRNRTNRTNRVISTINNFEIDYQIVSGGTYPLNISTTQIINHSNMIVKGNAYMPKLAFIPSARKYSNFSVSHLLHELAYDKSYWSNRPVSPLFSPKLTDEDFEAGAKSVIIEVVSPRLMELVKTYRQTWEQIKKETANLKWEERNKNIK